MTLSRSTPARRSSGRRGLRPQTWARLRFLASWVLALGLIGFGIPRVLDISWHGVMPVLRSVHWPAALVLVALWLLGLYVHSFVLTAAAPSLTHRRALTLNVTGSAVANVVPLGGAAGVELNRRMMKAWGIDTRAFTGYTFLTNLWDVGSKLLLPVLGVIVLARAGEATPSLRTASLIAGIAFAGLAGIATALLASPRSAAAVGGCVERAVHPVLRLVGRDRELHVSASLLEIRRECAELVANGWLRMSLGIAGYVLLQGVLLGFCLHLTGGGNTWAEVLAGFAVERLLTIIPITPGGVGVADLGLVGVLLALGGDPAAVTAAAVLYRAFVFAVEIPVGGGALGLWLLGHRLRAGRMRARAVPVGDLRRVAHVTDVFLPRLGGIETHVDELVSQQRARGVEADVLTPTRAGGEDPEWVRRVPLRTARRLVGDYDVVHVHVSMLSPYGIGVARAAIAAGVPALITVHSIWTGAGALLRLAAVAGVRRWPVAWSAVSGAAAESFGRALDGGPVAVLPNAVDVDSWRRDAPAQPPEGAPITIVSVMRLMLRKRPMPLLEIFNQVRALTPHHDVRLLLVGDGRLRRRFERRAARLGLSPYVQVTGRLPRPEVLDQLHGSAIYVAPAPKESFGIAVLEARCAGLPIVASRRSGVREFIHDRRDGILVDGDTEMAVALAELVVDDGLRRRIGAHNRSVVPPFDWSDVLDRTQALYRLAAERAAAAQPTAAPDVAEPVAIGA